MHRRISKEVKIGGLALGGGAPVRVQSMLNMPSGDAQACLAQAQALQDAGCEIVRLAVPDMQSVKTIAALKERLLVPIVADIHFDYRLALESVAAGVDKIRINPGNIGDESRVKAVADACRAKSIPIRIGVNSGSLEKEILARHGAPTPEALVESALFHASLLEKFDFSDIVISIKSSDVVRTVRAYELIAARCDYPLHLGVTEAGTERMGVIKSAVGIGSLLLRGIGDTVRVSLTADPVAEIHAAYDILSAAGVRSRGAKLISCPTCGRTKIDLIALANEVEERLRGYDMDITVAVMGCAVNGPGEAREADIGIAGGDGCGLLFQKGKVVKKVAEEELLTALFEVIDRMREEHEQA
ncbi:MAG: flavodoxin-dependent (E)-4-hydroxy-3-methylbut-2-enyl-diphosphate synthase [Oscillospiraceae bacterium]|jgi:(E)-4-hydroxy-3-methylbut-2-enyl-diphosphate synthase|nr:flavodoxin-dependent (E)-4-hydroxy-3-methylbut-2-enyl-diphosphate synthase [Oscillospiraceae bacterium]